MLPHVLQTYLDAVSDRIEISVAVHSIETGDDIAYTYDVVVDIGDYGELIIRIAI